MPLYRDQVATAMDAHDAEDKILTEDLLKTRIEETALTASLETANKQTLTALRERDEAVKAYADHILQEHPAPPEVRYPTKFGLGGGNLARTGVALDRRYYGASDLTKAIADTTRNESKNILSWNSFKFPYSWADMAKGVGDDWAKNLMQALSETVKPLVDDPDAVDELWVSLHHEPEGDGAEKEWRAAQDRMAHLVPYGVTGPLKFWLTTTGWGQEFNTQRIAQEVDWETSLYPTGAPIYGISYDAPYNTYGYVWTNGVKTTTMNNAWTDPLVYVDALAKRGLQFDVEVAIGEWGYSDEAFAKDPTWIQKVMDRCINNPYKQLRGAAYFDTKLNSIHSWYLGAAGSPKRNYYQQAMSLRQAV